LREAYILKWPQIASSASWAPKLVLFEVTIDVLVGIVDVRALAVSPVSAILRCQNNASPGLLWRGRRGFTFRESVASLS
jgi:hypothetical protein